MTQTPVPRFETGRPMLLAGLRARYRFEDMPDKLIAAWKTFVPSLPLPGQVNDVTYGAMCGTDLAAQTCEYMCAVEVRNFDALPADCGRMCVPPARYAVFTHDGPLAGLPQTWAGVHAWLGSSGEKAAPTPDYERYDDRFDPRTGEGVVEIWVPISGE